MKFSYTKEVNEYLRDIKAGDKSQGGPLFQITAGHLLGVARIYLDNKRLDEDVVSETFVRIFNYINSYDCSKDGYNWMCRIVQHTAYTINAKERKISKCENEYVSKQLLIPDDSFNEVEFFMQLEVLSDINKQIAIARFLFGMTYEEIGQMMKMSKTAAFLHVRDICKIIGKNYKED